MRAWSDDGNVDLVVLIGWGVFGPLPNTTWMRWRGLDSHCHHWIDWCSHHWAYRNWYMESTLWVLRMHCTMTGKVNPILLYVGAEHPMKIGVPYPSTISMGHHWCLRRRQKRLCSSLHGESSNIIGSHISNLDCRNVLKAIGIWITKQNNGVVQCGERTRLYSSDIGTRYGNTVVKIILTVCRYRLALQCPLVTRPSESIPVPSTSPCHLVDKAASMTSSQPSSSSLSKSQRYLHLCRWPFLEWIKMHRCHHLGLCCQHHHCRYLCWPMHWV